MGSTADLLRSRLDAWWAQSHRADPGGDPGVEANRRLTAVTGAAAILPLLLVAGSGLVFGWSPGLHFALGFAALPLTLLKLASTGWRFSSYYLRRGSAYRTAGPPALLPRLLGPVVAASAVIAFATGVLLFFQGRERGTAATLHTDSAVVLSIALLLHVSIHLRSTWRVSRAELVGGAAGVRGRGDRAAAVAGATAAGVVLAIALVGGYHWTLVRHLR